MSRYDDEIVIVRVPYLESTTDGVYAGSQLTRDWDNAERSEPLRASLQPRGLSDEDTDSQQRTVTRWNLQVPGDPDLLATDVVECDGVTYEVVGDVGRWKRGGRVHHVEAVLERVTEG